MTSPNSRVHALVAVFLLVSTLSLSGSESLWRDVAADGLPRGGAQVLFPSAYRLLFLDTTAFRTLARSAPRDGTEGAAAEIALPMPDGTYARFALQDSPIVDDALAAQLPEVKTYRVQGLDDPTATGRLDWTPSGFHGFVLSPSGTVYIDPYTKGNTDYYMSYWRKDYARAAGAKQFQCGFSPANTSPALRALRQNVASQRVTQYETTLRTYRLAIAATGEYTAFHGGTVVGAQAAIITTMNRINAIYEVEVGVRMTLVNNTGIIFTDPVTDPYTNTSDDLAVNQATIDAVVLNTNYDIGHLVGTGGGGVAYLGVVCEPGLKALGLTGSSSPVGDAFDVDYVAHELGHQFAANHTFNGTTSSCGFGNREAAAAYEPGSGSTIMAYAGICGAEDLQPHSDAYFHAGSHEEIVSFLAFTSCAVSTATGNYAPEVIAGDPISIPRSTPFYLTGSASDADDDPLTYNWEQFDLGSASPPNTDDGTRPVFRSFNATTSPTRTFPKLADILSNTATFGESLPATSRTMTFRLTVRDNHPGGVDYADRTVSVIGNAGPFAVTSPNTAVTWTGLSAQTVTWAVGGTAAVPISCANVKIQLSTNGGTTFPTTILASTPNDGTQTITVPNVPTTMARIRVECATSPFFDISNTNFTIAGAVFVTATATTATNVLVSWGAVAGADSYDVYRRTTPAGFIKIGSTATTSYNDPTAAANTAYLYAVKSIDGGVASTLSTPDLATTVIFTDPALETGLTGIRTAHVTQLRTAVTAVRTLAGLAASPFTDPILTAETTVCKGAHVTELRTALAAARATLALSALTFTDPSLTVGDTQMKGLHVTELRNGVK